MTTRRRLRLFLASLESQAYRDWLAFVFAQPVSDYMAPVAA